MKNKNIPKVDYIYNCFDDGKIKESRMFSVQIKEVILFKDIDKETLELWEHQKIRYDWIFNEETDYFIKTYKDEDDEVFIFARHGEQWFSMGGDLSGAVLDVDGSLYYQMKKIYGD